MRKSEQRNMMRALFTEQLEHLRDQFDEQFTIRDPSVAYPGIVRDAGLTSAEVDSAVEYARVSGSTTELDANGNTVESICNKLIDHVSNASSKQIDQYGNEWDAYVNQE